MQDFPLIGDYVQSINEPIATVEEKEPVDIVALWKDQQDLVAANINPLSRPITKTYNRIFGEDPDRAELLFVLSFKKQQKLRFLY